MQLNPHTISGRMISSGRSLLGDRNLSLPPRSSIDVIGPHPIGRCHRPLMPPDLANACSSPVPLHAVLSSRLAVAASGRTAPRALCAAAHITHWTRSTHHAFAHSPTAVRLEVRVSDLPSNRRPRDPPTSGGICTTQPEEAVDVGDGMSLILTLLTGCDSRACSSYSRPLATATQSQPITCFDRSLVRIFSLSVQCSCKTQTGSTTWTLYDRH
ncbi:hypothetical protein LXA43DRAFT_193576 [Ganoderma leucocontextum]|nr:hypothetical protein LXA43DRAFT_193576 [Ganoderma leucocontextum]